MQIHGHRSRAPWVGPRVAMMFPLHHGPRVAQNSCSPWRARKTTGMIQLKGSLYNLVHEIGDGGHASKEERASNLFHRG
ncbi:hypothetical protein WDU94_009518 [Cyamophila willieti]